MKKLLLIFCVSGFLFPCALPQQRVKTITLTKIDNSSQSASQSTTITVFNYTDSLLSSITVNGNEFSSKDLLKKISFQKDKKNVFHYVEINKKGEIEEFNNLKLKYQKDGKLKSLTSVDDMNKSKETFDLFFDEQNRLAAAIANEDKADRNYLCYFDQAGKCVKVECGFGKITDEVMEAVWENGLLKKLSGYFNRGNYIVHDFFYNENGLLQEEKIYSLNKEKDTTLLLRTYKVEYENGIGNEQKVYFSMLNWKVNLFFGAITCDYFGYIYY